MRNRFTTYIIELFLLLGAYVYWLTGKTIDDALLVCSIVLFYYAFRFIYELGKKIVFLDAVILMSILQWLFVTAIVYKIESAMFLFEDIYSEMPIDHVEYFDIVFPASFLFFAGIHLPVISMRNDAHYFKKKLSEYLSEKADLPLLVFGLGFFVKVTSGVLPIPGFLTFLLENFMYVGFFYALFTKGKYNIAIYVITIGIMLQSILGGALSTFVLWSIFIAVLVFMVRSISFFSKVGLLITALLMVYMLQSVKTAYREVVWRGEGVNYSGSQRLGLFWNMIQEKITGDEEDEEESANENLIRFNQGFLIAHAIDYVPTMEPYANGETVITALLASFIPRFLWPDKPTAGGRENMHRFTRLRMVGSTSMNISAMGDGYVNFGARGVMVFLFIFGIALNLLNAGYFRIAESRPSVLLWLPTVYIAVVVVETDFVTVFNHAIKSSILMWIVYKASHKFLGIQI